MSKEDELRKLTALYHKALGALCRITSGEFTNINSARIFAKDVLGDLGIIRHEKKETHSKLLPRK